MTFKSNMNYCAILCATIILPPSAVSIFCITRKSYRKYIVFKALLAQIFLFDYIINERKRRTDKVWYFLNRISRIQIRVYNFLANRILCTIWNAYKVFKSTVSVLLVSTLNKQHNYKSKSKFISLYIIKFLIIYFFMEWNIYLHKTTYMHM
jgi:hypothetical protein